MRKRFRCLVELLLGSLAIATSSAADLTQQSLTAEEARQITLSIQWGRGPQAHWDGALHVSKGRIVAVQGDQLEGPEERAALRSSQEATWTSLTRGAIDGIRVTIMATPDTVVEFSSPLGTRKAYVRELITRGRTWRMDNTGHELTIRRAPDDAVSLLSTRDHYIFAPSNSWTLGWKVDLGFARLPHQMQYKLELYRQDDPDPIWSKIGKPLAASDPDTAIVSVPIETPHQEGAYIVYIRFSGAPVVLPDRALEFLVLDSTRKPDLLARGTPMPLKLVERIDATASYGSAVFRDDGISSVSTEDGLRFRQSGSSARRTGQAGRHDFTLNWFAYRLQVKHPGLPHILELDYPGGRDRFFLMRILEENAAGRTGTAMDLGIVSRASASDEPRSLVTRRIVFWPTTTAPVVAFMNALEGSAAAVSDIRLYEAEAGLVDGGDEQLRTHTPELRGPYFEEPHLQKTLGAAEVRDPAFSNITRPDWKTYYDAIRHLCELIRFHGGNAMMVPVYRLRVHTVPLRVVGEWRPI